MDAYQIDTIEAQRVAANRRYQEFLRVPALSAGLYVLAAGSEDLQKPHSEDEVYYVVAGQAHIRVANEEQPVGPGSIIYVARNVEHRFFAITTDLHVLVFFAPAEYSAS